ncbi:MAG: DUF29 family protein [Nostoc sp.]
MGLAAAGLGFLFVSFRSKTLYNYFLNCLDTVHLKARRQAIQKTGLPPGIFPDKCPFTPQDIFNSEYFRE